MVLVVWCGDFDFDVGHGAFWSNFGVVIRNFNVSVFQLFVFFSHDYIRIRCYSQCGFAFLTSRIVDFWCFEILRCCNVVSVSFGGSFLFFVLVSNNYNRSLC